MLCSKFHGLPVRSTTSNILDSKYPDSVLFASCPAGGPPSSCVVPGVYALV